MESQYDPTKVKKAEVTIKGLLAEHGRQFSTIRTEVRQIPPAAVGITFVIKEGPKVKVGKIKFEGNKNVKTRVLRYAMKNLRPIGIPHSIFLENIFARTYDATKLDEDTERVRNEYQNRGYFKANVNRPQDADSRYRTHGRPCPLLQSGAGKAVDITMPIDEGERYTLGGITFKNNKAVQNVKALRAIFPIKDGDIFSKEKVGKGLENLRKAYGELGYINFTSIPDTRFDDDKKQIFLDIDVDEGKQFYVRRIEFQGNTTTRDKVIRREVALEEGNIYNSRLWELSLLRLNQLGYFDQLKPDDPNITIRTLDEKNGLVDLTLKVDEKGKNSIGLNGGVSGLEGAFIGINYATNNFLGLGETLQVQASVGQPGEKRPVRLYPALHVRPAVAVWFQRVLHQDQVRPGPATLHLQRPEPEPAQRRAAEPAELHAVERGVHHVVKLSAAPLLQARGDYLFVRPVLSAGSEHGIQESVRVPGLQWRFRAQRAERNHHQQDLSQLFL